MSLAIVSLVHVEETAKLIWPTWVFPILAIAIFTVLMFICWSFRDVANRHTHVAAPDAADHAGGPGVLHHGAGHPAINPSSHDDSASHGH